MQLLEPIPLDSKRKDQIAQLNNHSLYDFAIVGGGIHGATFAYLAALYGFKVVLFERSDYASETSSRSSKMAHGGLRYLEMLDFKQVFEGIRAREELFTIAPHLVKPEEFLIPVPKSDWFFGLKLGVGLSIYDLMVQKSAHKHSWIPATRIPEKYFKPATKSISGFYRYIDGLMSDVQVTLDFILAARRQGAFCLNYAEVQKVKHIRSNETEVEWKDNLTGTNQTLRAKLVINCAGPWAPKLHNADSKNAIQAKYSRGIHLLFNRPWEGPSLFLPMPGKARYYFVWPHQAGTMVGTTEREVSEPERDPLPRPDEIDEILARIAKDLPNSGMNRDTLHYCFAGVRTLPLRSNNSSTAVLSRRHQWVQQESMLSLLGGKFTTALWTSTEGLSLAVRILGHRKRIKRPKALLRAPASEELQRKFYSLAYRSNLDEATIARLVQRFGSDLSYFLERPNSLEPLTNGRVSGEVSYACDLQQAESLEDVLRRRLDLEFFPFHGLQKLNHITELLTQHRPDLLIETEVLGYVKRIETLRKLMGSSSALQFNFTSPVQSSSLDQTSNSKFLVNGASHHA